MFHLLSNKKNLKRGDSRYIHLNELNKTCSEHDKIYGDFKDLNRRTATNKLLRDKAFNVAKDQKYDGYQHGLPVMLYKFLHKKEI